jgi:hypothetical protein
MLAHIKNRANPLLDCGNAPNHVQAGLKMLQQGNIQINQPALWSW